MADQKKILKKSDILRTMAERATDKTGMMVAITAASCVSMLVLLLVANWVWSDINRLGGFIFGIIPCVAIPVLLFSAGKLLLDARQKKQSIMRGDVTVIIDTLTELGKCEETYYSHSSHRIKKITYDVFEFARGNTFTMKTGLWTQAELRRARDQFGVGQSFILVVYQKKSWELQMIYPEALYEYVDDMEGKQ